MGQDFDHAEDFVLMKLDGPESKIPMETVEFKVVVGLGVWE